MNAKIKRIFKNCGIETTSKGRFRQAVDVGFHSLRHTFVSLAANAGAPLALVQSIVGHSNPMMTEHYFHANAEALTHTVAALPAINGEVVEVDTEETDFARRLDGLDAKALKRLVAFARKRLRNG